MKSYLTYTYTESHTAHSNSSSDSQGSQSSGGNFLVSRSAVSELKTQDNQRCGSNLHAKVIKTRKACTMFPVIKMSGSRCKKNSSFNLRSTAQKDWCCSSSHLQKEKFPLTQFSSIQVFDGVDEPSPTPILKRAIGFTRSNNPNFDVIQKHPQRHIQGNSWQNVWIPLVQSI